MKKYDTWIKINPGLKIRLKINPGLKINFKFSQLKHHTNSTIKSKRLKGHLVIKTAVLDVTKSSINLYEK